MEDILPWSRCLFTMFWWWKAAEDVVGFRSKLARRRQVLWSIRTKKDFFQMCKMLFFFSAPINALVYYTSASYHPMIERFQVYTLSACLLAISLGMIEVAEQRLRLWNLVNIDTMPLHVAVICCQADMVRFLIASGADLQALDNFCLNVWDLAPWGTEIYKIIKEAGATEYVY